MSPSNKPVSPPDYVEATLAEIGELTVIQKRHRAKLEEIRRQAEDGATAAAKEMHEGVSALVAKKGIDVKALSEDYAIDVDVMGDAAPRFKLVKRPKNGG